MYLSLIPIFFFSSSSFINRVSLLLFAFLNSLFYLKIGFMWYFYRVILIFLGGVIIIFCYASACTANFRFFESKFYTEYIFLIVLFFSGGPLRFPINSMGCRGIKNITSQICQRLEAWIGLILTLSLFIVVKLVKLERGPLKSKQA